VCSDAKKALATCEGVTLVAAEEGKEKAVANSCSLGHITLARAYVYTNKA